MFPPLTKIYHRFVRSVDVTSTAPAATAESKTLASLKLQPLLES